MNITKDKISKFFVFTVLSVLFATIAMRIVSVVYSFLASDIIYMDSAAVTILEYIQIIFPLIIKSFGYSAIIWTCMFAGKKGALKMTAFISVIELLDFASAFVIDVIQKNIAGREIVALLSLLMDFLFVFVIISSVLIISNFIAEKYEERNNIRILIDFSNPPQRAIFFSSLFVLSARVIIEIIITVKFLYDVNFYLYDGELISIVSSYIEIFLLSGILIFLASTCFYALINRAIKL